MKLRLNVNKEFNKNKVKNYHKKKVNNPNLNTPNEPKIVRLIMDNDSEWILLQQIVDVMQQIGNVLLFSEKSIEGSVSQSIYISKILCHKKLLERGEDEYDVIKEFRALLANSINTKLIKYTYSNSYCFLMCLLDPRVKYYLVNNKYGFTEEKLYNSVTLLKDEVMLEINKNNEGVEEASEVKYII